MSKHETALALIDEQIEKTEKEKGIAAQKLQLMREQAERAEKEMKLIDWSIAELQASRDLLAGNRVKQDA